MPTIYRSSDASAPVLTGQAGSLVALLDACLVNGYTGKAAAGWTKAFSAANRAAYRQGGGNSFYLDVDDTGGGAGGAREAVVRGYEAMTAVGTGTNAFPLAAQLAGGIIPRKSSTLDASARAWLVAADDRTFYLFVLSGDSGGVYQPLAFGDFYSLLAADGFRTMIIGGTTANSNTTARNVEALTLSFGSSMTGHYTARPASGVAGSVAFPKMGVGGTAVVSTGVTIDGNLYMSRLYCGDAVVGRPRGWVRGLYQIVTPPSALNDGDTFSGTADFSGRTFLVIGQINAAMLALETSAWDTSS